MNDGSHVLPLLALESMDRTAVAPRPSRAIELGGPAARRARLSSAAGRDHPAVLLDDAAPEVRGVELHPPDGLVHRPELGQGERRSHESGRDARDLELDANALDGVAHDLQMVERQVDPPLSTSETGTSAATAASVPAMTAPTSRSTARYPTVTTFMRGSRSGSPYAPNWVSRLGDVDSRFLDQLSSRSLVQGLGGTLEPARDRPHSLERRFATLHEQHVELARGHGEDHHVDRDGEGRELRRVVADRRFLTPGFGCHYAAVPGAPRRTRLPPVRVRDLRTRSPRSICWT